MQLALNKIKVVEELSDETLCYYAVLSVDREDMFNVINRGCGGCDEVSPVAGKVDGWRDKLTEVKAYLEAKSTDLGGKCLGLLLQAGKLCSS